VLPIQSLMNIPSHYLHRADESTVDLNADAGIKELSSLPGDMRRTKPKKLIQINIVF